MLRENVRGDNRPNPEEDGHAAGVAPTQNRAYLFYALLCAAALQSTVLGHFFRGDDFQHLYEIVDFGYLRFAFTTHGGHLLFTSNSVFYLMHLLFGLEATAYYGLALLSHLLNVFLLYRIVEISSSRSELALAASLLWGMSALNQGSLGWYSAYGHVLVAVFLLWIVYDMTRIRCEGVELRGVTLLRWYVLLLAAATSFGTGIPIAMLSGLAAWLLLPDGAGRRRATLVLGSLALVIPLLYLLWANLSTPSLADSSPTSHLQANLSYYGELSGWLAMFSLWARMVAYGLSSLLLGPVPIITPESVATGWLAGLSQDAVTLISFALSGLLLVGTLAGLRRASPFERRPLLAYAILMLASYGIIALGRSAFFYLVGSPPLVSAAQPRYFYVAPALGVILLAGAAAQFPRLFGRVGRVVAVLALSWIAVVDYSAARWVNGYELPADAGRAYSEVMASIEDSILAKPPASRVTIVNEGFPVMGYMNKDSFPGWAALFIIQFPENEVEDRQVVFVERDSRRRKRIRRWGGERLNAIVVAPVRRSGSPGP